MLLLNKCKYVNGYYSNENGCTQSCQLLLRDRFASFGYKSDTSFKPIWNHLNNFGKLAFVCAFYLHIRICKERAYPGDCFDLNSSLRKISAP